MNLNPPEFWEPPGKTALQAPGAERMHFHWIHRDENLRRERLAVQDPTLLSCQHSQTTEALSTPVRASPTPGRLPGRLPVRLENSQSQPPAPTQPTCNSSAPSGSPSLGNVSPSQGEHLLPRSVHQVLEERRDSRQGPTLLAGFPASGHMSFDSDFIYDHLSITNNSSLFCLLLLSHVHAC